MRVHRTLQKTQHQSELYRIVFSSVYVKSAILALFVAFLVQPIAPVFANELAEAGAEAEASAEAEIAPEPEVPVVVEPQEELEEPVAETTKEVAESSILSDSEESETNEDKEVVEAEVAEEVTQEAPSVDENVAEETKASSTEEAVEDAATEQVEIGSKASSTETASEQASSTSDTSTDVGDIAAGDESGDTETEMVDVSDDIATTTATSTEEVVASEEAADDAVVEDNTQEEVVEEATEEQTTTEASETVEEEVASSTEAAPEPGEAINVLTNSDNRYQFGETECVSVGDGAFYCSTNSAAGVAEEDAVYAAQDADGDREIFVRKNGVETQITHNLYEDAAPYYDEGADEIVFHRLIDGRYQIMRYDLKNQTEEQLTDSRENNMEPAQRDGITVWQRWVTNNWEIAMLEDGKVTIVSDSAQHDVAPTIRDGYVMWHTTDENGGKMLSVYEIDTGISSLIADPDGGHVENPRFVLVYDTKYENGDVVTKQYDPETGEILPVSAIPAPLPAELPPTDSTGETRALIQTKSTNTKEELIEVIPETGSSTPPNMTGSSTPVVTGDGIEIDTPAATSTLDLSTSTEEVLPLTDFDVIVEPFSASSSAQEVDSTSATSSVE